MYWLSAYIFYIALSVSVQFYNIFPWLVGLPLIMLSIKRAPWWFWGMRRDAYPSKSKFLCTDIDGCTLLILFGCIKLLQVLFKLVVITVLVIAESADNCIKTVIPFLWYSFFFPITFITCNTFYLPDVAQLQSFSCTSSNSWLCKEWP